MLTAFDRVVVSREMHHGSTPLHPGSPRPGLVVGVELRKFPVFEQEIVTEPQVDTVPDEQWPYSGN